MHLPVAERLRALADPEVRRRLDEGAHSEEAGILRGLANWERLIIVETFAPENDDATGRTVGEVAAARGSEPFDTLLDIVIADELRTGLSPRPFGDDEADWKMRAEVWRNRDAVIGGSDAGAHLDMMCGAIYTTSLLGHGVREHQVVSLEEAVRRITDVPAPAVRAEGTRQHHARLARRPGDVRPGDRRPRARAHPLRLARWRTAFGGRREGDHARCWWAVSRCAATAWRPARCRARCCGRAVTPRR